MDNYRPITLANDLYNIWTTCIVALATDYIEARKIISPEHEGFRANRSYARAITHLSLCVEDAESHSKDIVLCRLDYKGLNEHFHSRNTVNLFGFYNSCAFPMTSPALSLISIARHPRNSSPHTATHIWWVYDAEPYRATLYLLSYSTL